MRKLLLIFIMLLLPAQWTWAAAAAYCTHETGAAAATKHFGHHEHQHRAVSGDVSKDTAKAKLLLAVDVDCEVCHFSGAQCLLHEVDVSPPHATPPAQFEYLTTDSSHVPAGLERPDRSLAA